MALPGDEWIHAAGALVVEVLAHVADFDARVGAIVSVFCDEITPLAAGAVNARTAAGRRVDRPARRVQERRSEQDRPPGAAAPVAAEGARGTDPADSAVAADSAGAAVARCGLLLT